MLPPALLLLSLLHRHWLSPQPRRGRSGRSEKGRARGREEEGKKEKEKEEEGEEDERKEGREGGRERKKERKKKEARERKIFFASSAKGVERWE